MMVVWTALAIALTLFGGCETASMGNVQNGLAHPAAIFMARQTTERPHAPYTKPEPAYAKWGKLAVVLTKRRYPEAKVVDYLHVGRSQPAPGLTAETFKLWLRGEEREFGVFVTITFDTATQKVKHVEFRKTDR
jgi:hypothetical protein